MLSCPAWGCESTGEAYFTVPWGVYLVLGHQPHESFPLCPPDYLDDLSQGHALLKKKKKKRKKHLFRIKKNRKKEETLTYLSLSQIQRICSFKYTVAHGCSLPTAVIV